MAERRMFTKKVTDDDNFMALSSSAQALYLHLSMSADDDGFCNQVSVSMFKAHASVADLQQLLEKRYIYQFDNGVIVIKHWRMANALRKDRYTPTNFKEELAKLKIKPNGAYTFSDDGCRVVANGLPDGCQVVATCLPQDSIGKVSIDKNSIVKDSKDKDIKEKEVVMLLSIVEALYNKKGIFKSSLIHTLKISSYILITTFLLNTLIYYLGEDTISKILLKNNFFGPFLASLVGLIPNCSASIILTELYLSKVITTGMLIGGLLTGSGIGLLVLFKVNKDKKENFFILISIYLIGVLVGIIFDLLKISF